MRIKQLLVLPRLPEKLKNLQELAHNMWYSWNPEMVNLLKSLDENLWEETKQNPVEMIARLPHDVLKAASEDQEFLKNLNSVYQKFQSYLKRKNWFPSNYSQNKNDTIAYFSLEYGLDTGLPVYSGGLGVLSGDTLKAASDLGIPMVAVGLLYRYGYFRQVLSPEGWQQERYEENDWYLMPVERVKGNDDKPLQVTVELDGDIVHLQVWKVKVGSVPLFLLDANIPDNPEKIRDITSVLYGGDKEMRIRQEIVLGIGGVKALRALNANPKIYHMNEGHSWFLTVERLRELMQEQGLSFNEALQYIWSTSVFTTHTPVPAGNEKFDPVLIERYLKNVVTKLGIDWNEFLNLGRVAADSKSEHFTMTAAALKSSAFSNGVSKLHGAIARKMWRQIWPELPFEEVPIKSITNGVHIGSWLSTELNDLYSNYFGPQYEERSGAPEVWEKVERIPDAELWRIHTKKREQLVNFIRERLKAQMTRRGTSQFEIQKVEKVFDPRILTIGFARRFSSYKRGNLIFSDPARFDRIINNPHQPVQIVFAGKAHPLDNPGKEIIRQLIGFANEETFRERIVFLEDYDINIARMLVQGCDVWLNNPRRPLEASGTSGMKASVNGVLHLSILDGWWAEGYNGNNGFKIGNGEENENTDAHDKFDSEMLYTSIEREVVPMFYNLNEIGLPAEWIARMKNAIHSAGRYFSAQRMLMDYTNQFYISALETSKKLSSDKFEPTKNLASWIEKMSKNWEKIAIRNVDIPVPDGELFVGQKIPIGIDVYLGEIAPGDVSIELVSGRLNAQEQIVDFDPIVLSQSESNKATQNGVFKFSGEVTLLESGRFGISARVIPHNENLPHTFQPKLISWW